MYSVHSDVTDIQICHTAGRSGDRLSKLAEQSHTWLHFKSWQSFHIFGLCICVFYWSLHLFLVYYF